jgi:hypothetical protein
MVIALAAFLVVTTWYAGYRYYASHDEPFSSHAYGITLARQVGGDVTDAARVLELYGGDREYVRGVLVGQLSDNLVPSLIQGSEPSRTYSGFGTFVATALNQESAGGIRVGVPGEALLAFGLVGAALFGVLTGIFLRTANWLLSHRRLAFRATGAFFVSQILFVIVTGSTNLLAAVTAVVCGALLLLWGLRASDAEPIGAAAPGIDES